jgi:hypothetical protein
MIDVIKKLGKSLAALVLIATVIMGYYLFIEAYYNKKSAYNNYQYFSKSMSSLKDRYGSLSVAVDRIENKIKFFNESENPYKKLSYEELQLIMLSSNGCIYRDMFKLDYSGEGENCKYGNYNYKFEKPNALEYFGKFVFLLFGMTLLLYLLSLWIKWIIPPLKNEQTKTK